MHPGQEIAAIGRRKSAVRERIAGRRRDMSAAAGRAFRPLAQLDQGYRLWQRLPRFARSAAIPMMLGLAQMLVPRVKTVHRLLRWAPMALTGWRVLRGAWQGARGTTSRS